MIVCQNIAVVKLPDVIIGPYMNKCHYESCFSIDLNKINNDIEEEYFKETIIERHLFVHDSNATHLFKVVNTIIHT